jgi:hypothetical protein
LASTLDVAHVQLTRRLGNWRAVLTLRNVVTFEMQRRWLGNQVLLLLLHVRTRGPLEEATLIGILLGHGAAAQLLHDGSGVDLNLCC